MLWGPEIVGMQGDAEAIDGVLVLDGACADMPGCVE